MRRILFILALFLISYVNSYGQSPTPAGAKNNTTQFLGGLGADSAIQLPLVDPTKIYTKGMTKNRQAFVSTVDGLPKFMKGDTLSQIFTSKDTTRGLATQAYVSERTLQLINDSTIKIIELGFGLTRYGDTILIVDSSKVTTVSYSTRTFLPYNGANSNTNTGEYGIATGQLTFDLTPTGTPTTSTTYWDATHLSPATYLNSSVSLVHGQMFFMRGRNKTGAVLAKGTVVYINDAQGNNPTIAKANADLVVSSQVIGITAESISDNGTGYVSSMGIIDGVNTSSFVDGDALYLDTIAGGLTNQLLPSPHNVVFVGYALNSTNNGRVFLRPSSPISADVSMLSNGNQVAPTQGAVRSYVVAQGYGPGTIKALTGDVTASGTGTVTATLATVNASPATYTNATLAVDSKGRVTSASSGTAPVTAVSGTSGRVSSTGGTTPVIDIVTANATPATYGSASAIPVVTVDSYGRATTITTVSPVVTASTTNTFTNKRYTPRVNTDSVSYTTSVTMNFDNFDGYVISAQAGALLFNAPSGTPTNLDIREIVVKDNGSARLLTWNTAFNAATSNPLPTTTTAGKILIIEVQYLSSNSKWNLIGKQDGL
jgi:hypothetical protein